MVRLCQGVLLFVSVYKKSVKGTYARGQI